MTVDIGEGRASEFWAKVDYGADNECWEWLGGVRGHRMGYGYFYFNGNNFNAHRYAYMAWYGKTDLSEMLVLHRCDNPLCCNPYHLYLGTNQNNMDDMTNRGRRPVGDKHYSRTNPEKLARGDRHGSKTKPECTQRGDKHWTARKPELIKTGEKHHRAKLTNELARQIREEFASLEMSISLMAEKYNLHKMVINNLVSGKTYKSAGGPITKLGKGFKKYKKWRNHE